MLGFLLAQNYPMKVESSMDPSLLTCIWDARSSLTGMKFQELSNMNSATNAKLMTLQVSVKVKSVTLLLSKQITHVMINYAR